MILLYMSKPKSRTPDLATIAVGRVAGLESMRATEDVHELHTYARRAGVDLTQAASR